MSIAGRSPCPHDKVMRHSSSWIPIAVAALCVVFPTSAGAADSRPTISSSPIEIGRSYRFHSTALGEQRTINVVLPASYDKEPTKRYPVLYLIDGGVDQDLLHVSGVVRLGALWGRSAEAIIVGIETADRRRELVGPTKDPELLKRYPTAGASDRFRAFIRTEVKPLVEHSYRTDGRNVVLGESLAGLFVTETYLTEPTLFDAYAAIDPSLWWDREALSLAAAGQIGARQAGKTLFLALAKEQLETPAASERLVASLGTRGLAVCVSARPELTHAIIYQQITPQAVQYLLPPSAPAPPEYGFGLPCAKAANERLDMQQP